mmetsp:Transcript_56652/g.162573  ORF Transcript_56652/g.162573 Transcript_56652/m.162573 type:complete len:358 (-) Transcript_56652:714-1787(-)
MQWSQGTTSYPQGLPACTSIPEVPKSLETNYESLCRDQFQNLSLQFSGRKGIFCPARHRASVQKSNMHLCAVRRRLGGLLALLLDPAGPRAAQFHRAALRRRRNLACEHVHSCGCHRCDKPTRSSAHRKKGWHARISGKLSNPCRQGQCDAEHRCKTSAPIVTVKVLKHILSIIRWIQVRDIQATASHNVVVRDQDTIEGTCHHAVPSEKLECEAGRGVEYIERAYQESQKHGGIGTGAPLQVLRPQVQEVVGWRNDVGGDVGRQRRNEYDHASQDARPRRPILEQVGHHPRCDPGPRLERRGARDPDRHGEETRQGNSEHLPKSLVKLARGHPGQVRRVQHDGGPKANEGIHSDDQ